MVPPYNEAKVIRLSTGAVHGLRFVVSCVLAVAIFAVALWSLRIGFADLLSRSPAPGAMARAIRWVPGDAVYRARWSLMAADPTAAVSALEKAVALNPYYSWAWIQLGLAAEAAGDPHRAESLLTRAAAVDRRFKPAWALCDYYYRHPSANRFWYWSRQALVMSEADSRPVFRLAWHMEPDAATILARALPPTARARRDFLAWLLAEPLAGRRCAGPGGHPASCAGAPSAEAAMPAIRAVLTSAG